MLLFFSPNCVYCGMAAECRDHFVPIAHEKTNTQNFEVRACFACNAHAASKVFTSFAEKARHLVFFAKTEGRYDKEIAEIMHRRVDECIKAGHPARVPLRGYECLNCGTQIAKRRIGRLFCGAVCNMHYNGDRQRRRAHTSKKESYAKIEEQILEACKNIR